MTFRKAPVWKGNPSLIKRSRVAIICAAKHRHKSQGAAEAQRRSLSRTKESVPDNLGPYHCQFCGGWHLGRRRAKYDGDRGVASRIDLGYSPWTLKSEAALAP
jgi:hypothetical protein